MLQTLSLCLLTYLILTVSVTADQSNLLQIQIDISGPETIIFSGWCDIAVNKQNLKRIPIEGSERLTLTHQGEYIDYCEIVNASEKGSVTLTLQENGKQIYLRSTKETEMKIHYGPTMKRYSTKPVIMR